MAGHSVPSAKLLDELMPLASDRGGILAFEYFFEFGGGEPPWTSGCPRRTALQALARATDLTGTPVPRHRAPRPGAVRAGAAGRRGAGRVGPHYLIYTFNPDLRVINAFLQSIIGLYDYAQLTGDPRAQSLYETGEAEARVEIPALQHRRLVAVLASRGVAI